MFVVDVNGRHLSWCDNGWCRGCLICPRPVSPCPRTQTSIDNLLLWLRWRGPGTMGQCGGDHGAPQLLSTLVYNGPLLQTVTDGTGRGERRQADH